MLHILALWTLLLSSELTLMLGIAAISSSVRFLTVECAESRRRPASNFRDGGLYAEFKAFKNCLPNSLSNIVKG